MHNNYQTTKPIAHKRRRFNPFMRKFKLSNADLAFIAVCLVVTIYLTLVQPLFVSVFGCAALLFFGLWQISRTVPVLEKLFGSKIRFWHLATAVITVTALLNNFQTPAQAVFLSGLEQFMTNLASEGGSPACSITSVLASRRRVCRESWGSSGHGMILWIGGMSLVLPTAGRNLSAYV